MSCKPAEHPFHWDRHGDVAYDKEGKVDHERTKLLRRQHGNFEEYETPMPMMPKKHK